MYYVIPFSTVQLIDNLKEVNAKNLQIQGLSWQSLQYVFIFFEKTEHKRIIRASNKFVREKRGEKECGREGDVVRREGVKKEKKIIMRKNKRREVKEPGIG